MRDARLGESQRTNEGTYKIAADDVRQPAGTHVRRCASNAKVEFSHDSGDVSKVAPCERPHEYHVGGVCAHALDRVNAQGAAGHSDTEIAL